MVSTCGHIKSWNTLFLREHGQHHGDVWKMGTACIRIVENGHVTWSKLDMMNGLLHGHGHGAQMHRHVIAHGDGFSFGIEDGTGIVAPLLDVGRECGAPKDRAHLFCNRVYG